MRQKTLLLAVLGSALLVSAGVAGALMLGSGSAAASQPAQSQQSITVSANGEIEASPDQAIVRVAITATGNDSTTVRQDLASSAESMRAALEEYGLDSEDVRTARYDIRQEREHTPQGTERGNYRGIHAFEITLNDTGAAGEVIDVAVNNGADQVNGVSFTLSDDKRQELHNEALTQAMGNARERANTLATAGDLSVTGVHTIVSTETRYHGYRVETAAASLGGDSTSIEAGAVTVTANVRVTYNATTA